MEREPRILVLRGGAIGDFIVTLPVLHALRERWPGGHIELVGYPHVARLAELGGLVNSVRSLDESQFAQFYAWEPTIGSFTQQYIQSFDIVLCLLHDPDGTLQTNLKNAGAKHLLYCSPIVIDMHAADQLVRPLRELAIFVEEAVPELTMPEAVVAKGEHWMDERGLSEKSAAIHPGSGNPQKNWPVDRFVQVAGKLRETGYDPFFILGEADHHASHYLAEKAADVHALTDATLPEVAGVLSNCCGYVGNDSGISHLAAALGVPGIALFGPSNPMQWRPRGCSFTVIKAPQDKLENITVDEVWELFREMIS